MRDDLIMFICNDEPDILSDSVKTGKPNYSCSTRYRWIQARLQCYQFRCIRKERFCNKESLKAREVEFEIDGFTDCKWIEVSSKTLGTLLCGCIYRSPKNQTYWI